VQQTMDAARDGWLLAAASCDGDLPCDLSVCVSRVFCISLKLAPVCLRVCVYCEPQDSGF
jgi:hypothetical protein